MSTCSGKASCQMESSSETEQAARFSITRITMQRPHFPNRKVVQCVDHSVLRRHGSVLLGRVYGMEFPEQSPAVSPPKKDGSPSECPAGHV